jgi:hydrogenase expression/formation protein HypE
MLGYDPLYLACEGRVVAVLSPEDAPQALARWQALPQGSDASSIGVVATGPQRVVLTTELDGDRILDEMDDDPLPRIC